MKISINSKIINYNIFNNKVFRCKKINNIILEFIGDIL